MWRVVLLVSWSVFFLISFWDLIFKDKEKSKEDKIDSFNKELDRFAKKKKK